MDEELEFVEELQKYYNDNKINNFLSLKAKIYTLTSARALKTLMLWAENEYFKNKNNEFLDILTYVNYCLGNYHMSYFYSHSILDDNDKDMEHLYQCLSLFQLGYFKNGIKLFNMNKEKIFLLCDRSDCNKEHLLQLFIMTKTLFQNLPNHFKEYLNKNVRSKYVWIYVVQNRLINDKNKEPFFKIMSRRIPDFKNDEMMLCHIYNLLGQYFKFDYFKYPYENNRLEDEFFQNMHVNYENVDYTDLKAFYVDFDKIKSQTNFSLYDFEDEDVKIHSYPMQEKMASLHVIETKYGKLILDCGAFIDDDNNFRKIDIIKFLKEKNIAIKDIKGVFVSHAHLDHYGSLDILIENGIDVYMTSSTRDLIRKSIHTINVDNVNIIKHYQEVKVGEFTVIPFENGHILGSCGLDIYFGDKRLIYTGDFSVHKQYTINSINIERLKKLGQIDYLIMESTYGTETLDIDPEDNYIILYEIINIITRNNVKVLMPALAIGRAQEIVCILKKNGPLTYPVLIDGMAGIITYYYQINSLVSKILGDGVVVAEASDIQKNVRKNSVIIASSGMMQKNSLSFNYMKNLMQEVSAIIKVGFINNNNPAIKLIQSMSNSFVHFYDISLSDHATYNELLITLMNLKPKNAIFVHGKGIRGLKE